MLIGAAMQAYAKLRRGGEGQRVTGRAEFHPVDVWRELMEGAQSLRRRQARFPVDGASRRGEVPRRHEL
ncbi:unnamed protein product [Closterium sp. NIES-54]